MRDSIAAFRGSEARQQILTQTQYDIRVENAQQTCFEYNYDVANV